MRKTMQAITEEAKGFPVDLRGDYIKIPNNTRSVLNKKLQDKFSKGYLPKIPLDEMFETLRGSYIEVVDEAGDLWSGFLTGSKGNANFDLAMLDAKTGRYLPVENAMLVMSWYKMDSGNYEINSYIS